MKNLFFSLGMLTFLFLIITACEKQNDLIDDPQENPAMGVIGEQIRICHNTGISYSIIEIDTSAWAGHEAHGDILYQEFPVVGVFRWVYDYGEDSTALRIMYVTEVTETTFEGYGLDYDDNREWTIADGTIYQDESFSFTIDYDDSNDYIECEGAFICGDGLTGNFGANGYGALQGLFHGGLIDENELIEINP